MTDRTAGVTWIGGLGDGSGTINQVGSGAFGPLPVTWPSRAESSDGRTSPEELLAAAWASCFSMALAHGLGQAGSPPARLETTATVTFEPGVGIVRGSIHVVGTVPGLDQDGFAAHAGAAKEGCPVSKALAGIPDVALEARLT
ncbi:MAG: OsmC family peroxiredoxin [Thermoleophilia bacterium]|nr:OsmC family peroxiredoxin [Thermoleophilia bacterium]